MFNAELYTSQHARAQDIIYVRATQGLAKFVGREILYVDVFAHFEWRARTGMGVQIISDELPLESSHVQLIIMICQCLRGNNIVIWLVWVMPTVIFGIEIPSYS